jgi:hypothetical protein
VRGTDFAPLYEGPLSARLVWEASLPCPCASFDGAVDEACPVCGGRGVRYAPPSEPFRAALLGLTARALEALSQRFGPGLVGDATASLPSNAPAWEGIRSGDRLTAIDAVDVQAWQVSPGRSVRLPVEAVPLSAEIRDGSGAIQAVAFPTPDANGRISVAVSTVLRFKASRRFEVVRDVTQVRAFGVRLPKKLLVRLLDESVR